MNRLSISNWSIITKLILMICLIIVSVGGIVAVDVLSFRHVEDSMVAMVDEDIAQIIENARLRREFSVLSGKANLLIQTFDEREKTLQADTDYLLETLKRNISVLKEKEGNLQETLQEYTRNLQSLFDQCIALNEVIGNINVIESKLNSELTNIDGIVVEKELTITMEVPEEAYALRQLGIMLPGFREILFEIITISNRAKQKYLGARIVNENYERKILLLLEEFYIGLRATTISWEEINPLIDQLMEATLRHKEHIITLFINMKEFQTRFDALEKAQKKVEIEIGKMNEHVARKVQNLRAHITNEIETSLKVAVLLSCIVIVVLVIIGIYIVKMVQSIKDLNIGIKRIGSGDLAYKIKNKSKDEIGQLAISFNKMTENLASSLQKEKGLVAEAAAASAIAETEKQKAAELQEALLSRDREINHRQLAEEETERSYYALAIVNKLLNLSLRSTSIVETLEIFLEQVLSLPYLDLEPKGAIFLVEDDLEVLKLKAHRNLATELLTQCEQVPFGRCLCGRAAQSKEIVFADCVDERHDTRYPGITPHGHYCIPILSAEKELLGVFTLYTKAGHNRAKRIEEILLAVADVMASTIERLRGVNEKEKMKAYFQQAQKMESIGTLAGGIAHDFNNILGTILGYTDLAKEDTPEGSSVRKDLENVLKAGNRAKELVKQILAFSRQADTECIPFQPASIVNEAIKMLRPTIPATIDIKQNIDPKAGFIFADPSQVHQILMNLCTNAFHAMEETGGTLDISLKEAELDTENFVHEPGVEAETFVQLTVRDTGPGIAPEIRDKIFEPYFTTKEPGKGTGMGLAIIHGIVKSYGGFISLDSEPGEGSAFHVYIPAVEKHVLPETEETEETEDIPRGKERILFIDDEEMLAELGKEMLERIGYKVTVRKSSLEALEKFQNQPDLFDLVITDQTMPGMTGSDLARRMMQIRPDIPIILCTGYSTIISEKKAKAMGIKEFTLKPLVKRDISKLIRKVLDRD